MGRLTKPQRDENKRLANLVRLFKKTGDKDAFDELARVMEGYLQHLSKRFFFVAGHGPDDVYQEALYALAMKAIPDYQEDKGPFIGFAKLCIRRHVITVLKSANNGKNKALNASVSLDATVCNDDEDGPVTIAGFIRNGDEALIDKFVRLESHGRLKALLIDKLTPLETRILRLYMKNMSYLDIVGTCNKGRRKKNRIDCKVVDNALCRIKKKALELDEAIARGDILDVPDGEDD